MTDLRTEAGRGSVALAEQGSFICGGSVYREGGEEYRGAHMYVQYQIPVDARPLPLILVHGGRCSGTQWEMTPDGRPGFRDLLLRAGFAVYILDLPGRGRSTGNLSETDDLQKLQGDDKLWNVWRLGQWVPPAKPKFFDGLQFPTDDDVAVDRFLRHRTFIIGNWREMEAAADAALRELLDRVGPCVVVTHSGGGPHGWRLRAAHEDVRAVVAYEPAYFPFPEGDVPPPVETKDSYVDWLCNQTVMPADEWAQLTEVPIQIVYGDNIAEEPSSIRGFETHRVNVQRAAQFVDMAQRQGGDAELVRLPEKGLHGNTHFPFSDLNNVEVTELFIDYLASRNLA